MARPRKGENRLADLAEGAAFQEMREFYAAAARLGYNTEAIARVLGKTRQNINADLETRAPGTGKLSEMWTKLHAAQNEPIVAELQALARTVTPEYAYETIGAVLDLIEQRGHQVDIRERDRLIDELCTALRVRPLL